MRSRRCSRSLSQPTLYLPLYFAMSLGQACRGLVRRSIGHVEKERAIFPPVLVQVSKGVIGERISSVEIFIFGCVGLDDPVVDGKCGIVVRKFFTGPFFTGSLQTRVKEVTAPIDEAVIAVETPFDG